MPPDSEKSPLWLLGGGGHCRSCIDVIEQEGKYHIEGIIDRPEKIGELVLGYPVVASDEALPELLKQQPNILITVGQIKTPAPRERLSETLQKLEANCVTIVSPLAYVSRHATLGKGTIVMHGAMVNAGAIVGQHVILNTKSLVEHDATIEDHVHISTGAIVNGGTRVGRGSFLGSNGTTREYISIGDHQLLGAGAKVMKSTDG